jgi:hypothetical protein
LIEASPVATAAQWHPSTSVDHKCFEGRLAIEKKVDGIRYDDSVSVKFVGAAGKKRIFIDRSNGNDPFEVNLTLATWKDCKILVEALNRIIGGRAQAPANSEVGVE